LALEQALDWGQVRAELEQQELSLVLVLLEELNKKDRDFDY
jgi:hypothetical protein